ncbi:MAG: hypothetical protein NT125_09100 [Candidatus Bipolaricaulota bacterium]|nr:hypothetical protein [Candidatus Bipolaricaulota bacterium]
MRSEGGVYAGAEACQETKKQQTGTPLALLRNAIDERLLVVGLADGTDAIRSQRADRLQEERRDVQGKD